MSYVRSTFLAVLLAVSGAVIVDCLISNRTATPLVYQRLRFDRNYLQIYRQFQKELTLDEDEKTIVTEDADGKETLIRYYENNQFDSNNLTHDDLIFEALDRHYTIRFYQSRIYTYDKKDDLEKASDPRLISATRCKRDMTFLMKNYDQFRRNGAPISPEAAAFFDSFASEEPGVLFGNYYFTGNWRECKRRQLFNLDRRKPKDSFQFNGRYCIASLKSNRWPAKIRSRRKIWEMSFFNYQTQKYDYERFFRIQVGICLPESCDSKLIQTQRHDLHKLTTLKLNEPYKSYDLFDLYCLPDETSELRKLDPPSRWLFYSLLTWLWFIFVATIYDLNYPLSDWQANERTNAKFKLISSISLLQNCRRLFETESLKMLQEQQLEEKKDQVKQTRDSQQTVSPNDLLFMNFFKVVAMPMIVWGHVGQIYKHMDRNPLDFEGVEYIGLFHSISSVPIYVDVFFVVTGFITSYLLFSTRRVELNSLAHWFYAVLHRYLRLVPLYLVVFLFCKHLFKYTSHGPVWDYGTNNMTIRAVCSRESILTPLTLTSNLYPLAESCILPAWYIASDMQFFIICIILLVILSKSPRLGWIIAIGIILASHMMRFHTWLTDSRVRSLDLMRPTYDIYIYCAWHMNHTYVYPHYRISPYLVGVLAGHYVYMVLSGKWTSRIYVMPKQVVKTDEGQDRKFHGQNNDKLAKATTTTQASNWLGIMLFYLGLVLFLMLCFITWIFAAGFPVSFERQVRYFAAVSYTLFHLAAGLSFVLLPVTIMLCNRSWLRKFMSQPFWGIVARVNYAVLILHTEVIYFGELADYHVQQETVPGLFKMFINACTVTYLLATIMTLLFEFPLAQLERQFLMSIFMRTKAQAASTISRAQCVNTRKIK